jgi:hypothetical protein
MGAGVAMTLASSLYVADQKIATCAALEQSEVEGRMTDRWCANAAKTNSAFLFIKPHACKGVPGAVEELVKQKLEDNGITVTGEGSMDAETIDEKRHIDTHYGAIASKAVMLKPSELNVPEKGKAGFVEKFGLTWDEALSQGLVYNAMDAADKLGVDGIELEQLWRTAKVIKFGGGFYCGKVGDIFIMNGFYMSMRAAYCSPGERIHWMTVSWPADELSWEDFRGRVLGATDPSKAADGSVRRSILVDWETLGLEARPNTGNNGVHASASPFEALAERMNWLGVRPEDDEYGRAMLATIGFKTLDEWTSDPQVSVDGVRGSLFDALEDISSGPGLEKSMQIAAENDTLESSNWRFQQIHRRVLGESE